MTHRTHRTGVLMAVLAASLLCLHVASAKKPDKPPGGGGDTTSYTLVTLDDRAGYVRGYANDVKKIHDTITCVGFLDEAGGMKAVLWEVTPVGSSFDVTSHDLAGGEIATAISANGEIVGVGTDEATQFELGLYWPRFDAAPVTLAPLAGDNKSWPVGINAAGVIVGYSTNQETTAAVAWRTDIANTHGDLVPFVLGDPPGTYSVGHDINQCDEAGSAQVVGGTEVGPVIWLVNCLTMESIGPLPLVPETTEWYGSANGINNAGDACGGNYVTFRCLADGTFEELSVPRRATSSAYDINDQRQVVGHVYEWNPSGGLFRAYGVMWQANGKRVALNKFAVGSGYINIHAGRAIDDNGIIAASGVLNVGGESRPLLLIPE